MERKNKSLTAAAAALIAAEFVTAAASALGAASPVILFGCAATLLLALYVCISVILKPKGSGAMSKVEKFYNLDSDAKNEDDALEQVLFENHERVGYTVIDNILTGKYKSEKEIDDEFLYLNFEFPKGDFIVLVMCMEYYDGNEDERAGVFRTIVDESYGFIDKYVFVHSMPNNTAAYIIQPETKSEGETKRYVYELVSRFRGTGKYAGHVILEFGSSGMCAAKKDIHLHFERAMEVLHYNITGYENEKLWYNELQIAGDKYYLPFDIGKKLLDYTVSGNKIEITNTLDQIYNENFLKRSIPINEAHRLVDELLIIVEKIVNHIQETSGISGHIPEVGDKAKMTQVFEEIHEALSGLCDKVSRDSVKKNQRTLNEFKKYIDDNYTSCDLSLTKLSMHFHLSENYISMIFKKYAGENFSNYLENKRIYEACVMMADEDTPIKDIAGKIGYGSDATFRRAFKRNKGVSPTEYKAKIKENTAV